MKLIFCRNLFYLYYRKRKLIIQRVCLSLHPPLRAIRWRHNVWDPRLSFGASVYSAFPEVWKWRGSHWRTVLSLFMISFWGETWMKSLENQELMNPCTWSHMWRLYSWAQESVLVWKQLETGPIALSSQQYNLTQHLTLGCVDGLLMWRTCLSSFEPQKNPLNISTRVNPLSEETIGMKKSIS